MAAEEEEEGGGEVFIGGVQVQAQPKVKKEKVCDRVREDCCCRSAILAVPSLC